MQTIAKAIWNNFLGNAADWYKVTIVAFLILNPLLLWVVGPFVTGWILVLEFIFTLAMALSCYPLQPGGLLAIEAVAIGMASPESVRTEVVANFPVILLLMFMVAGIYFMKDLLLFVLTKLLLGIQSKIALSLTLCLAAAFLSAFLDALTVIAVIITSSAGFFAVYHRVTSGRDIRHKGNHDHTQDDDIPELHKEDLEDFRAFLRSLMMHGAVGTALGGVATMVGEPQNLLIAIRMDWSFGEFFLRVLPVSLPVLVSGLATCFVVERFSLFGYGGRLPGPVRQVLREFDLHESKDRTTADKAALAVQAISAVFLIVALAFHWAEVGLIGLAIIVTQTAFNGITEEHQIGRAFQEALPFTALLVVFFAIVAVIHDGELFAPVTDWVLQLDEDSQPGMLYLASGMLSAISDNVFVATVYINELSAAFQEGHFDREHFNVLAVAVNTGTNIPSVATPNGQAAFLFLLTSAIAPLIRLSYLRMVVMALPYAIVMSVVGYFSLVSFL